MTAKTISESTVFLSWAPAYPPTGSTYFNLFVAGLHRISGLFYIRYPAGYPVSFAGYLAGRISGYPARRITGRISGKRNLIPDIKKGRISGATLPN